MTLKELIKMMKSKRLPADRRQFHQLGWFSIEPYLIEFHLRWLKILHYPVYNLKLSISYLDNVVFNHLN